MSTEVASEKLGSIVNSTRLSNDDSSTLNQLHKDVQKLCTDIKSEISRLNASGDPQTSLEKLIQYSQCCSEYEQVAKQLRLGGSCTHGADKGPRCKRCIAHEGRLQGPFAGYPDGLEVGDYWYHVLEKKSSKVARLFIVDLDRISDKLQSIDETLKVCREKNKDLKQRASRLKRIRMTKTQNVTSTESELNAEQGFKGEVRALKDELGLNPRAFAESQETEDSNSVIDLIETKELSGNPANNSHSETQSTTKTQRVIDNGIRIFRFKVDDMQFGLQCSATEFGYRQLLGQAGNFDKAIQVETVRQLILAAEEHMAQISHRRYRIASLYCKSERGNRYLDSHQTVLDAFPGMQSPIQVKVELDGVPVLEENVTLSDAYLNACSFHAYYNVAEKSTSQEKSVPQHTTSKRSISHPGIKSKFDAIDPPKRGTNEKARVQSVRETIHEVNLQCMGITWCTLSPALASLRYRNNLVSLNLSRNPLHLGSLTSVFSTCSTMPNLVQLDVSYLGTQQTQRGLLSLDALSKLTSLRKLNLSGLPLLNLSGHSHVETTDKVYTCDEIATNIKTLTSEFQNALDAMKSLTWIELNHTVNVRYNHLLCKSDTQQPCVTVCAAFSEAISNIARGLETIPGGITFQSNTLPHAESASKLLKAVFRSKLRVLDVSLLTVDNAPRQQNETLSTAMLSALGAKEDGNVLQDDGNVLQDDDSDSLSSVSQSHVSDDLNKVNLSGCAITNQVSIQIGKEITVGSFQHVTELSLAGCSLNAVGCLEIVRGFVKRSNRKIPLETLSLRMNPGLFAVENNHEQRELLPEQKELLTGLKQLNILDLDLYDTGLTWAMAYYWILDPYIEDRHEDFYLRLGNFRELIGSNNTKVVHDILSTLGYYASLNACGGLEDERYGSVVVTQPRFDWQKVIEHYEDRVYQNQASLGFQVNEKLEGSAVTMHMQ